MISKRLFLLQTLLCITTVCARSAGWSDPQPSPVFMSKRSHDGRTFHRLTENRLLDGSGWEQVTGPNHRDWEISSFSVFTREFPERNVGGIGPWADWIGGFTKKMRVCQMRHSRGQEMYILTDDPCSSKAPSSYIWEDFNFYVSDRRRSKYNTRRVHYVSCQDSAGFSYVKLGTSQMNCGRDGRIDHGSFHAAVPDSYACEYLTAGEGATISYRYDSGRISGAQVRCAAGYSSRGETSVTCRENGRWSNTNPGCSPVECGSPPLPDRRMSVEKPGPYRYGTSVTYVCEEGYDVDPPEAGATCQTNGQWSHSNAECKPVDCRFPGHPRHGNTVARNGFQLGARIKFECNNGYRLEGATGAVCMISGRWSNERPTCIEVRCPGLLQPENGRHHGGSGRQMLGQELTFQCDQGHSLVGEPTLTCMFDPQTKEGVWSSEAPTCSEIACEPLSAPQNGHMLASGYSFGSQISFSCDIGFTLRGAETATCLDSEEWDAQPPTCTVNQCRDPGTPEHATRRGNAFTYGSTLTYTCEVGYERSGANTIVCDENGRWTAKPPTCTPVGCPELFAPVSGSKEGDTFEFGARVEFSCFPGYQIQGPAVTECLASGRWSEETPVCEACPYGYYKSEAGTGNCTQCPVRSYTTSEASNSRQQCICETDTHGPPGGPCQAVQCTYPADPEHGHVVSGQCGTNNMDSCAFTCDPGYILQGSRTRLCTSQGWNGHMPVCVACRNNTYKRDEGSISCRPCPTNTYTPAGTLGVSLESCVCLPGFTRDQDGECFDVDECAEDNGGCEDTCENTQGGFECACTTGGYALREDGRTCYQAQTCSPLTDTPNNGSLNCRRFEEFNGVTCGIQCNPGYFFVSGSNNYLTCGVESGFEWSHKRVNRTARIPSCTQEFFVDVQLPVTSTYESPFSCNSLEISPNMMFEKMRVQEFVGNLYQCTDSSGSDRFCSVRNLTVNCEDVTSDNADVTSENQDETSENSETKSQITVSFEVLLRNKEDGALHPSCQDSCKRSSLREMLRNAWNLTKGLEKLIKDKDVGVNSGNGNLVPIRAQEFSWDQPKLLCEEPGRVLTKHRLCVPCDTGFYLPERDLETCIPCPKGTYQNEQGQTVCKPCLEGSTTLTDGTPSPHMCNVQVTDYLVNTTSTVQPENEDDASLDLDSFPIPY